MEMEKMFDVIFVIEGTAINGAYMNDLKTNYLIPALEYFSQSLFEEKEYLASEKTAMFYGVVLYKTAQSMPNNSTITYGPFTNPQKIINVVDKLDMAGGGSESNANLAEGLATALCCFEDLKGLRHTNDLNVQKHCILICNSAPYSMPVLECYQHEGKSVEQLAAMFYEKKINFSIISPRKIPILFKLFVKADGDLPLTTKNFCKDPRHLVLLKGFNLKERSSSPNINTNQIQSQQSQQMSSISSVVSPMSQQNQILNPNVIESSQTNSMGPGMSNLQQQQISQQQGQQQVHPVILAQQQVIQQSHNFNSNIPPVNRWLFQNQPRGTFNQLSIGGVNTGGTNMQQQQQSQLVGNIGSNSNSVLISQLNQPPNAPGININQQMQNQMLTPVQQQMRMQLLNQQQQATATQQQIIPIQQQASSSQHQHMHQQSQHNQPGPMVQNNAAGSTSSNTSAGNISAEREKVWSGTLEWLEKSKTDQSKSARSVQCQVFANIKDGEVEVKADNWPPRLLMQLMPKHLVGNVGGEYLKDSKVVVFKPQSSESLEALSKIMNNGFAGCVHFNVSTQGPSCDIRILILLYTPEKKTYLGFIPNDQTMFVDQLRKAIQQKQQPCVNPQQQQPTQMQQQPPPPQQLQPQQQQLQAPQQQQPQHQQQQQQQQTQQSPQPSQLVPAGIIGTNVNMVGSVGNGNSLQQSQSPNMPPETNTQQHFNAYNPNQVQLQIQQDQIQNNLQQIGMMQRANMGGLMQHQGPNTVNMSAIQGVNQINGPQQPRMIRPMMSNPGLRMLLQQPGAQPGNQFRPQLQQMVGSNPNMMGGSGPSQLPRSNNFEDPNFDFM